MTASPDGPASANKPGSLRHTDRRDPLARRDGRQGRGPDEVPVDWGVEPLDLIPVHIDDPRQEITRSDERAEGCLSGENTTARRSKPNELAHAHHRRHHLP